jgi:hypothetical protein
MIWKHNLVTFKAEDSNFDEFKSRGLHEKQAAVTWNFVIISTFA